mgnify:CR=1 FL=1
MTKSASNIPRDKHVGHVLVFTEKRQMQEDFNGFRIGSHNDELGNPAIERFSGFVGTLFDLLVVRGLL